MFYKVSVLYHRVLFSLHSLQKIMKQSIILEAPEMD